MKKILCLILILTLLSGCILPQMPYVTGQKAKAFCESQGWQWKTSSWEICYEVIDNKVITHRMLLFEREFYLDIKTDLEGDYYLDKIKEKDSNKLQDINAEIKVKCLLEGQKKIICDMPVIAQGSVTGWIAPPFKSVLPNQETYILIEDTWHHISYDGNYFHVDGNFDEPIFDSNPMGDLNTCYGDADYCAGFKCIKRGQYYFDC